MLNSSASRRREVASSGELPRTMARGGEQTRDPAVARYEGWMVRYGRRKIGRSFFHTRYFVLDNKLLAYYKKKPKDNMMPLKSLLVDGNCRVEDRGLKTHHG